MHRADINSGPSHLTLFVGAFESMGREGGHMLAPICHDAGQAGIFFKECTITLCSSKT